MKAEQRLNLLKLAAIGGVGLILLDRMVITPAIASWHEQGDRITELQAKVQHGEQLLRRQDAIRQRWSEMVAANLPNDLSAAENQVFKAVGRWARDSQINFTSLTPQWQTHDEGYETLECRAAATGNQASIGRFIYEMEADHMPVNLEECELATRDAHGALVNLTARFSFLRLKDAHGGPQ